jgi:hypothetical protein
MSHVASDFCKQCSAEISIDQRRAENARLDQPSGDPIQEVDPVDEEDIVDRALALVATMDRDQRDRFFKKYTRLTKEAKSVLVQDKDTAEKVNLIGNKRNDPYTDVASALDSPPAACGL